MEYPVDNKHQINDFLSVMLEVYRNQLDTNYQYNIYPYAIAGNDWIYNCKELEFIDKKISSDDYYIIKYDVDKKNINTKLAQQFFDLVSDNERSKNNLMLVHAYTMYRKMKLIQAEKWFLIKDFGRSVKVYLWKLLKNC